MTGQKNLGVLMLDVSGLELSAEDREVLAHPQVGGVILGLHGRNYSSLAQLQELVAAIRECNEDLLLAVDQEGGRVQRFRENFTRLPPMHVFSGLHRKDPGYAATAAQTCGWLMAAEILSCGLDISFAPVVDLYNEQSRVIGDRAFASEPAVVVELVRAFVDGMHEAGMKATGKHFPGHGSVIEDSHVELPVDDRSLEQLLTADLLPFVRCADILDAMMPGHVLYPQIDNRCAALSRIWLQDILRKRLGYGGIIFSDDLTMAAAESAGDVVQRAELALGAGCDMILVCNDRSQALDVIAWLDSRSYPASHKLLAMQGVRGPGRDQLLATDQWQRARRLVAELISSGG
jgi:beta-N-acetylhexosaminidase